MQLTLCLGKIGKYLSHAWRTGNSASALPQVQSGNYAGNKNIFPRPVPHQCIPSSKNGFNPGDYAGMLVGC
jgi:hypothetical protein